jgi:hypothetical protein
VNLNPFKPDYELIDGYDQPAQRHGLTVTNDRSELGISPWRYMAPKVRVRTLIDGARYAVGG